MHGAPLGIEEAAGAVLQETPEDFVVFDFHGRGPRQILAFVEGDSKRVLLPLRTRRRLEKDHRERPESVDDKGVAVGGKGSTGRFATWWRLT